MFEIDSAAFRRDLSRASSVLPRHARDALIQSTQSAATYAKLSRLYKSHTHGLQASIHVKSTSQWARDVIADAKYARYVEDGTMRHFIFPSRRRALRFVQDGQVRFARWVFHPGTKSRPFMKEARDLAEPLFDRLCRQAVDVTFS